MFIFIGRWVRMAKMITERPFVEILLKSSTIEMTNWFALINLFNQLVVSYNYKILITQILTSAAKIVKYTQVLIVKIATLKNRFLKVKFSNVKIEAPKKKFMDSIANRLIEIVKWRKIFCTVAIAHKVAHFMDMKTNVQKINRKKKIK